MRAIIIVILLSLTSIYTLNAQDWITDFNEAKETATKENKKIVLVFQGSDWCAPCIKLDQEIFETDEFIAYAKDHFVMLQADFPRRKKNKLSKEQQDKNNKLAEAYNKKGYFPYVVVLNSKGTVLGTTIYKKTNPTSYFTILDSFK